MVEPSERRTHPVLGPLMGSVTMCACGTTGTCDEAMRVPCVAGLLACLTRPAMNEIYLLTISYVVLVTFLLVELALAGTAVLR